MSRVKTPDASPYSVALALLRTSSTSLRRELQVGKGTKEKEKLGEYSNVFFLTLPALELGDDHDRAEGLLLSDVHVVEDVGEDGGLKEEACRVNKLKDRESRSVLRSTGV